MQPNITIQDGRGPQEWKQHRETRATHNLQCNLKPPERETAAWNNSRTQPNITIQDGLGHQNRKLHRGMRARHNQTVQSNTALYHLNRKRHQGTTAGDNQTLKSKMALDPRTRNGIGEQDPYTPLPYIALQDCRRPPEQETAWGNESRTQQNITIK